MRIFVPGEERPSFLKKRSKRLFFLCFSTDRGHGADVAARAGIKVFLLLFLQKKKIISSLFCFGRRPPTLALPTRGSGILVGICVLALSGCGDLPRPFAGNPGREAMALAVPPPPRLIVPAPTGGLLPEPDAKVWSEAVTNALVSSEIPAFAAIVHPGEWQLRLSASFQDSLVTPKFTLIDPKGHSKGDVMGAPVSAADWTGGNPAVFQQSAAQAAPQIVALLRAVDASIKQSDPNSLYNRPARIFFSGVTGAPGDGNAALARGMRIRLPDTGDQLVDRRNTADFLLRGTVKMTDEPGGQQQVEIHWLVSDPAGQLAGDVAQGHDVAKGTLDHYWGDIAAAVTDEAASGVHEVITNYSGRRKDGQKKDAALINNLGK